MRSSDRRMQNLCARESRTDCTQTHLLSDGAHGQLLRELVNSRGLIFALKREPAAALLSKLTGKQFLQRKVHLADHC